MKIFIYGMYEKFLTTFAIF